MCHPSKREKQPHNLTEVTTKLEHFRNGISIHCQLCKYGNLVTLLPNCNLGRKQRELILASENPQIIVDNGLAGSCKICSGMV